MELQAKNEQIAALQAELSKERQHSREQAERIVMLADQAQQLQLVQMRDSPESLPPITSESLNERKVSLEQKKEKNFWKRILKK